MLVTIPDVSCSVILFFFNDTATTEIYTLSLHDALPISYNDGKLWADDIAAVIGALDLRRPVLAGWSYGGFIISDYVQAYGQGNIGAINYVAAAVMVTPEFIHIGPGFLENAPMMMSPDSAVAIAGTRRFVA